MKRSMEASWIDVGFLARQKREIIIAETGTFFMQCFEHGQPLPGLLTRRPALMKLREVEEVDACVLELGDKTGRLKTFWNTGLVLILLPIQKIERVLPVVMTGECFVAG